MYTSHSKRHKISVATCIILLLLIHSHLIYAHTKQILPCRGDEFRREFARIGELRSIIPSNMNLMALTATASNSLQRQVMKTLGMRNASAISIPPSKNNIKYIVGQFTFLDVSFGPLAEEVLVKQGNMEKVLIFCRTINDCSTLYFCFKRKLGHHFICPAHAPDISKYRRVEMFHS